QLVPHESEEKCVQTRRRRATGHLLTSTYAQRGQLTPSGNGRVARNALKTRLFQQPARVRAVGPITSNNLRGRSFQSPLASRVKTASKGNRDTARRSGV